MPMGIFWHCIIDPCRGLSVPNVRTCHVAPATISCTTCPPFVVCTLPDPLWWCHDAWAAGLTDHVWTLREVLLFHVPPRPQPVGV